MTAQIRAARPDDASAIIALWHACGLTRPWNDPQADLDRALAYAGSTVLVAEEGGRILGSAMTGYEGHRGWIYYLAVDPARQGQGHGRRLLDAACDWLKALGCPKVELMLRDGNPVQAMYQHLGWETQGVQVFAKWLTD